MRLWGIFGTSLLVLGFLTACTPATTQVATRSVGDCWGISAGAAQDVFLDEGQAPVNCDENALSATYFVGQVQDAPDGGYLSDLYLEAKTLSDLPDTMHQDLINECQQQLTEQLSFESLAQLRQTRIMWDFTLPNHAEWNKGQRWFSCEMSLLEKGSLLVEPVWAGLPNGVDTVKEMAKNPSVLLLCFDTATNAQLPSSRLGIVASCDEARWKLQPIALDNGYGEFYPGTKQATLIANSLCEAKYPTALKTYAQPLLEQDWNSIQPTIQCWYSNKADPTSPEEIAAEEARIAAEQEALAETAARQAAANRAWREYLAQQEAESNSNDSNSESNTESENGSSPESSQAPDNSGAIAAAQEARNYATQLRGVADVARAAANTSATLLAELEQQLSSAEANSPDPDNDSEVISLRESVALHQEQSSSDESAAQLAEQAASDAETEANRLEGLVNP